MDKIFIAEVYVKKSNGQLRYCYGDYMDFIDDPEQVRSFLKRVMDQTVFYQYDLTAQEDGSIHFISYWNGFEYISKDQLNEYSKRDIKIHDFYLHFKVGTMKMYSKDSTERILKACNL